MKFLTPAQPKPNTFTVTYSIEDLKQDVSNTLCKVRVEADPEPHSQVVKPLIYSSISEVFSIFPCTDDEILKQDV